jgi:hypothetical protein
MDNRAERFRRGVLERFSSTEVSERDLALLFKETRDWQYLVSSCKSIRNGIGLLKKLNQAIQTGAISDIDDARRSAISRSLQDRF